MKKRRQYRELGDIQLGPELVEKIQVMTETAERDVEEARVDFHWGREQLATVKRAADILGIPYQAYIKQVVFKQAVGDILDAQSIIGRVEDQRRGHAASVRRGGEIVESDEDHVVRQRLEEHERRREP